MLFNKKKGKKKNKKEGRKGESLWFFKVNFLMKATNIKQSYNDNLTS